VRLKGYLPNQDFLASLQNGLGRMAFVHKKYANADRWYDDVLARFGSSTRWLRQCFWQAVARYQTSHDHTVLGTVAEELRPAHPASIGASNAIPWLPPESKKEVA